jgi:gas vesicle protein
MFYINNLNYSKMRTGKVLLGALGGIAAGALLGVLFAPDKGSITRHKIAQKSKEYVDDVKGRVGDMFDNIAERFESGKNGYAKATAGAKVGQAS